VPDAGGTPVWLRELNLEPALRAAAGLGVRIVQQHQDQLVAAAWEQIGDPSAVARYERRMEAAATVLRSVLRRHVAPLPPARLVQFLGPAQARTRASVVTLRARLAGDGLPVAFSSAPLRRSLRPAGTLARRRPEPVESVAPLVDDADADGARTPAERLEARERRERLEGKVRLLSPAHRAVLVLRDIEGLTYEEIADVTESPLGSVKGRLHRARAELIELLRRNTYDWELPA
jgi:RNA polymerase sigma factor (sigma-70 family)